MRNFSFLILRPVRDRNPGHTRTFNSACGLQILSGVRLKTPYNRTGGKRKAVLVSGKKCPKVSRFATPSECFVTRFVTLYPILRGYKMTGDDKRLL